MKNKNLTFFPVFLATLYFIYFLIGVLNEVEQWKIVDDNAIDNELYFLAKKGGNPDHTPWFISAVKRSLG